MSNEQGPTPFTVKFSYLGDYLWKSISIPQLQIEAKYNQSNGSWTITATIVALEKIWKFREIGADCRKLLRSLFSRQELPRHLGLSNSFYDSLYDTYTYFDFRWQVSDTSTYRIEPFIKSADRRIAGGQNPVVRQKIKESKTKSLHKPTSRPKLKHSAKQRGVNSVDKLIAPKLPAAQRQSSQKQSRRPLTLRKKGKLKNINSIFEIENACKFPNHPQCSRMDTCPVCSSSGFAYSIRFDD